MPSETLRAPNPRRVAAGRLNRQRRGALTPAGRLRLRQAALRDRPWEHATGPTTLEGRARAASNGRHRQTGPISRRQARAEIAEIIGVVAGLWEECEIVANSEQLFDRAPGIPMEAISPCSPAPVLASLPERSAQVSNSAAKDSGSST